MEVASIRFLRKKSCPEIYEEEDERGDLGSSCTKIIHLELGWL